VGVPDGTRDFLGHRNTVLRPTPQTGRVLATVHVLAGAAIGRVVRRPGAAFALGVASHFVLDMLPHWGTPLVTAEQQRTFMRVAVGDGLALTAAFAALAATGSPAAELAGAFGGLLPDLDKPAAKVGVRQLWPDPIHHVHVGIQWGERPHRWPVDGTAAATLTAVLAATRPRRTTGVLQRRPGAAAS
jgi:hypothetical protein